MGKLSKVNLRDVWNHEARDFTNWLAKDENIERINELVGLTLTDVRKEVSVGSYKVDITCEDSTTGSKVIIENQLEKSDHDHLGKLITYASGLNANHIIWIVKEPREEHRSAIEWLNNITNNQAHFFLLEAELLKIDDSKPALRFNILEQPNEWSKLIRSESDSEARIKRKTKYQEFWNVFNEVLVERKTFNPRKASTDHWYDLPIGTSEAHLNIALINKDNRIRVSIYIPNSKDFFDKIYENKELFESELDFVVSWERMDDKKTSRIETYIDGFSLNRPKQYKTYAEKALYKAEQLKQAYSEIFD